MDWVTELKNLDKIWPQQLFMRNTIEYPITTYMYLALSKCVVGDYKGAALQFRRALSSIKNLKEESGYICEVMPLVKEVVKKFKIEYSKEFYEEPILYKLLEEIELY